MARNLWRTPQEAADTLANSGKTEFILFYELAATGLVHAGILRTLLRIDSVRAELVKRGLKARFVFGLSDRAALKSTNYLDKPRPFLGRQLKDVPSPEPTAESYFDWSCLDIRKTVSDYDIRVDEFLSDDAFYQSERYRSLTREALLKKREVIETLAKFQKEPRLFQPLCSNCRKMYCCAVSDITPDGEGWYHCHNCEFSSAFSIYTNGGLLSFKLELAIKWEWLGVDMHFTGIDHLPAIQSSREVSAVLFRERPIHFYLLNLTSQGEGGVMHKSLRNFTPVTHLSAAEKRELRRRLISTPDRSQLKLPHN